MPFTGFILSLFLGWPYLLLALSYWYLRAVWMLLYRQSILTNRLYLDEVTYEVLNDLLLPWLFVYVLMTPPVINWRGRKIRVTDGKIRYE